MKRNALLLTCLALLAARAGAEMPSVLADTAARGGFSSEEVLTAETQPVARIYEAESTDRQVTVLGLAKIPTSPQALTNMLLEANGVLRSEALRQIGVFGTPPSPGDVSEFRLPESDLETLVDCEVGDCKFKLGEIGIQKVKKIDWNAPDARQRVDVLMREGMVAFARRYQESGSDAMIDTADKAERQSLAEGADRLTAQLGLSKDLVPLLHDHLLHYPGTKLEGARDRLLWTIRDYGYRPVTSVVHSVIYRPPSGPPDTLITLKNLYASHYFLGRQRLIGLFADSEDPNATYIGYSDRLLFDGDVGSVKRRLLEAGVVKDTNARLELMRAAYE